MTVDTAAIVLLLALVAPWAVVLMVALLRGYSIEVRLHRGGRGEHEREPLP